MHPLVDMEIDRLACSNAEPSEAELELGRAETYPEAPPPTRPPDPPGLRLVGNRWERVERAGTVYIDVETATAWDELVAGLVTAGLQWGTPAAAEWLVEHAADGALLADRAVITCWAVATSDGREEVRTQAPRPHERLGEAALAAERELLEGLIPWVETARRIVAHNGFSFDFPMLWRRGLACNLPALEARMNPGDVKPWDSWLVDTSESKWCPRPWGAKEGWGSRLDDLARLVGIVRPAQVSGEHAPAAWYAGDVQGVAAHCLDDVRTLRAVTRRLAAGRGGE